MRNDRDRRYGRLAGVLARWAVLASAALFAACGSTDRTSVPSRQPGVRVDRSSLRPVAPPDFSKVDASVEKQLRQGEAALRAAIDNSASSDPDLGAAYGAMGMLLMAAEYRDEAEPGFRNAEALMPDDPRWPYYLGHLYRINGDSARAAASFERALRLRPDDLPTLVWLGNEYLDQGRAADAEPLFSRALAAQPRSVPALFGSGRTALAKQEYARAIDDLEQALSIDPRAVVIHYPLAMAYRGTGDVQKAEAHLRVRGPGEIRPPDPLMLEIDALLESAVAYEVRGAAALDESQWDVAEQSFRRAIALAPNEPSLRHKLGTALAMKGDTAAAVQQFQDVTRRWPAFAKAHYSLGVILASSGRQRESLDQLSQAVKAEPTYAEARLQLAEGLRLSGRAADSLSQYEETMRLNPRLAEARLGYAFALASLQRFDDARVQLTEGARIYPDRREFAESLQRLPPPGPSRR